MMLGCATREATPENTQSSGLAKLISPEWRRGDMLGRILDTFSHGTEKAARFLKQHP